MNIVRILRVACLPLALLGTAKADIRVLLSFDAAGHHVHQVIRDLNNVEGVSPNRSPVNLAEPPVTLTWYDSSGQVLATTRLPDPRIARSPAHIDGDINSLVTLDEGAWLATGPDFAQSVAILLPAWDSLALGAEQWHASLESRSR